MPSFLRSGAPLLLLVALGLPVAHAQAPFRDVPSASRVPADARGGDGLTPSDSPTTSATPFAGA